MIIGRISFLLLFCKTKFLGKHGCLGWNLVTRKFLQLTHCLSAVPNILFQKSVKIIYWWKAGSWEECCSSSGPTVDLDQSALWVKHVITVHKVNEIISGALDSELLIVYIILFVTSLLWVRVMYVPYRVPWPIHRLMHQSMHWSLLEQPLTNTHATCRSTVERELINVG